MPHLPRSSDRLAVGQAGAAQTVDQRRHGHHQIGHIDDHHRHRGDRGEHTGLAEVHQQHQDRQGADRDPGDDRRAGPLVDLGQELAERQPVVTGHREHHPRRRGLDRQRGREDRHRDRASRVLPSQVSSWLSITHAMPPVDSIDHPARRRHQRGEDHQPAADERHQQRVDDRLGRGPARIAGLLGKLGGTVESVHHIGGHQHRGQECGRVTQAGAVAAGGRTACAGLRSAVKNIAPTINTTPMISIVTPVTVIRPMNDTPTLLMMVHSTIVMVPSMMPLVAPLTDASPWVVADELESAPDRGQHASAWRWPAPRR